MIDLEKCNECKIGYHYYVDDHKIICCGCYQTGECALEKRIPIEWLKENYGGLQIVRYIIKDWELENETDR